MNEQRARAEAKARTAQHVEAQEKVLTAELRAMGFIVSIPQPAQYSLDDLNDEVARFVAAGGFQPGPLDLYYQGRVARFDENVARISVPFMHAWCAFPGGRFPSLKEITDETPVWRFNEQNGVLSATFTKGTVAFEPGYALPIQ